MSKKYNAIVHDEVLYWFDVLQDNSIKNIVSITGINRNKVQQILNETFNHNNSFSTVNHKTIINETSS